MSSPIASAIYFLAEGTGAADRGEERPRRVYNMVERRAARKRNRDRRLVAKYEALSSLLERLSGEGISPAFHPVCEVPDDYQRVKWDALPATCDPMR